MAQYEQPCECQIAGTAAYDRRIDHDEHLAAGLVYAGLDEDGESLWIGTDAEWKNMKQ
jgi:hypothetical protein